MPRNFLKINNHINIDSDAKKVAIIQSSYIPWKGYFDLINIVDEFVFYDSVQFTKRDWRSRNKIKSQNADLWLTIPINVKGKFHQKIFEAETSDQTWRKKHWQTIEQSYRKAPFWNEVSQFLRPFYLESAESNLSKINRLFISAICDYLGIKTKFYTSMDLEFKEDAKNLQLINLCKELDGKIYYSGPAAKDYLNVDEFSANDIEVRFFDYAGYPEYQQLFPPFDHFVSVIDLLFMQGSNAKSFMKTF